MNIKDLDLNLLVLFDTIYQTRSISRAADVLDMNQPTVSNALGRLRKQLDDPLFVRNGKGVAPTRRAEAIITPIRRALNDIRSINSTDHAVFDPSVSERELRLYMFDILEPVLLPRLIEAASASRGMSLRLIHAQAVTSEIAVSDGIADIAVAFSPIQRTGLKWERLCEFELVVVARKGHPALTAPLTSKQILGQGHVVLDLNAPSAVPGAAANSGRVILNQTFANRKVVHVSRSSSIATTVASSDLIGFMPRLCVQALPDQGGLQIFEPPQPLASLSLFMIWSERADQDPAVQWLRQQIKDSIAEIGGQACLGGEDPSA